MDSFFFFLSKTTMVSIGFTSLILIDLYQIHRHKNVTNLHIPCTYVSHMLVLFFKSYGNIAKIHNNFIIFSN